MIDGAIDQFRLRLQECVAADGGNRAQICLAE